ncbi:MAG: M20/M25/M40 family metallo-hydrolase [Bacilli bacterium]|nr:M20/M25/M40 family metallo-hydrolase [Bacilli bacterium]
MKDVLINSFIRISSIPRMSGNEKRISDFFVSIAKNNNLEFYQDENYNVLIKKKGNINGEPIAFQAHLDMVCVKKADSNHDFNVDGIDVIIDGDEVTAKDTSLGADQGVGLALMLTLIEDNSIKHPDLEFLFTTEEETTFKGAITFPYDKVASRKMINLDYCMDNAIVIGSAGDIVNEYTYEGNLSKKDLKSYKLSIKGLKGGNSGENIEASENNAIITLVKELLNKNVFLRSINGGTYENDIATDCDIELETEIDLLNEFNNSNIKVEQIEGGESFSTSDTKNILNQILELKSGYISKMASGNLGMIRTNKNKVAITYLFRTTSEAEFNNFTSNNNNNFKVAELYRDRIWNLDKDSFMFKKYKEVYKNMFNENPLEITAQGGLEIASIQKRISGLDIISIGANMENIHTVNEITHISSWEKLYNIIINMLK